MQEGLKDFCLPHSRQYKKHGRIVNTAIAIRDKTRKCSVEGCGERYSSSGYCQRHYSQFIKHGEIIGVERMLGPRIGERKRGKYIYLLRPAHPRADKRGYVKRAWLVWEENTGHVVTPPEVVHHKNEIRNDDAFDNLELLPDKPAHVKRHGGRIGGIRIVTKDLAVAEMLRCSALVGGKLTTRKFNELSTIGHGVIIHKFGWNAMKEELCIR